MTGEGAGFGNFYVQKKSFMKNKNTTSKVER